MTIAFLGVDVAKDRIDVFDPATDRHSRIPISADGLDRFARTAVGCQVIFEASGGYERPLCEALTRRGVPFTRLNPRQVRYFARATGYLAKTDRVDACVLARMGAALQPAPDAARCPDRQALSDFLARRQDLVAARVQERNRAQQTRDPVLKEQIAAHIAFLGRQIADLERHIAQAIAANPAMADQAARLREVPGIGPFTAALLIARLPELGRRDRRKIAALAGLAPQACDSGKQHGTRRVWGGRAELRRAMFIAALSASRCDATFRAFRQRLEEAGKTPKTALLAVARKLLTILNAIIRSGSRYVSQN